MDIVIILKLLFISIVAGGIFFLPTIIAGVRGKNNVNAIFVLNLVGGLFFGIGWFIALVWAFCNDKKGE